MNEVLKAIDHKINHLNKYKEVVEELNLFFDKDYVLARSDYVRILTKRFKI